MSTDLLHDYIRKSEPHEAYRCRAMAYDVNVMDDEGNATKPFFRVWIWRNLGRSLCVAVMPYHDGNGRGFAAAASVIEGYVPDESTISRIEHESATLGGFLDRFGICTGRDGLYEDTDLRGAIDAIEVSTSLAACWSAKTIEVFGMEVVREI